MRFHACCRSFDQFANLVLESAVELITVGNQYAEIALGLYVVRGENVVLLGEIDAAREPPQNLQQVGIGNDVLCACLLQCLEP